MTNISAVLDYGAQSASANGLDLWRHRSDDGSSAGVDADESVVYIDPPSAAAAAAVSGGARKGRGKRKGKAKAKSNTTKTKNVDPGRRSSRLTAAAPPLPLQPPPPPDEFPAWANIHSDLAMQGTLPGPLPDLGIGAVEAVKHDIGADKDAYTDAGEDDDDDTAGFTPEERAMSATERKRHFRLKFRLNDPEEMLKVEKELRGIDPLLVAQSTHREKDRKKYKALTDPFKKNLLTQKQRFALTELRRKGQSCVYAANIRKKRKSDTAESEGNINELKEEKKELESVNELLTKKCRVKDAEVKRWKVKALAKDKEIAKLKAAVAKLSPSKK